MAKQHAKGAGVMAVAPQGSQPAYGIKAERDVLASMRDGTRLAVDVYRPDAPGRFPALLSMHPYSKDIEDTIRLGEKLQRMTAEFSSVEAGDHEFWARHGYVHVIADVRGTGKSEGAYFGLFSPQEQRDGYDLVEWVAAQDWCDTNVGMCGISYLGVIQYLVAAQQPPHLKAIFPHDAWGDTYRDIFYHGGIPSVFGFILASAIALHHGAPVSRSLYGEEELVQRVEALLSDEATSFAKNPTAIRTLRLPDVYPISFDVLFNREDGPFWRERSPMQHMHNIQVPTYLGSELHKQPTMMHVPGVSWGWDRIPAPKKVAFRPCNLGGLDRPFYEFHDEMLRWFDHWLKGIDTGIMDEPAVKIWVRGREVWRYADEWPLLSVTSWTRVYLRSEGRLTTEPPPEAEEDSVKLRYEPAMPVVLNPVPLSPKPEYLSYTTAPFERGVEVIGPIALHLQAALSAEDGDFIAVVKDVDLDGSECVLTRGWLRASHRALDPETSTDWRPFHPHTNCSPINRGERYEFAIEIRPIANFFKRGHCLKLEIWPCDFPNEPGNDWTLNWGKGQHIPYGKAVTYEIFHTPQAPSYLVMPVIREGGP